LSTFLLSVNTQSHGKQVRVSQNAFRETIVGSPRWCIKNVLLESRWCYFYIFSASVSSKRCRLLSSTHWTRGNVYAV